MAGVVKNLEEYLVRHYQVFETSVGGVRAVEELFLCRCF